MKLCMCEGVVQKACIAFASLCVCFEITILSFSHSFSMAAAKDTYIGIVIQESLYIMNIVYTTHMHNISYQCQELARTICHQLPVSSEAYKKLPV